MKPVVIGIGGGSASGKSTVASAVAEQLGDEALLLVHDRYYRSLPAHLVDTPTHHNFDHPAALDTALLIEHLDAFRSGSGALVPRYDFGRHRRAPEAEWLEARPVVLVEGILVLSDAELRRRFDHAVYVHTPDDLRLMRRIRRDRIHRGRDVDDILAQYEATVRPMHEKHVAPSRAHADVVLDGTSELDALVRRVLQLIDDVRG